MRQNVQFTLLLAVVNRLEQMVQNPQARRPPIHQTPETLGTSARSCGKGAGT